MHPKLIIHGGLGSKTGFAKGKDKEREALADIARQAFAFLLGNSALETAAYAVSLLEDYPIFNAGTGSKIQSDGIIRMTASIMDGDLLRFAGVINIQDVKNPVQVARILLGSDDSVLSGEEALLFARKNGFLPYNTQTTKRRQEYENKLKGNSGTVGCVALDCEGRLAAATSTGGKGFEIPGRVSDSSTVAGNYANPFAAVSCTGTGEYIVNAALAAKIVTRVTDGMELQSACNRSIVEISAQGGSAGVIALDANGNICQMAVSPYLTYAIHDGDLKVF